MVVAAAGATSLARVKARYDKNTQVLVHSMAAIPHRFAILWSMLNADRLMAFMLKKMSVLQ